MWNYEKRLQFPVNIKETNPEIAKIIITQYGGPDGELSASMRYLAQRYTMPYNAVAVFCTLGAVVLALYRYKPQKELGYFLLYLTVLTLWALVIILAPVGSSGGHQRMQYASKSIVL